MSANPSPTRSIESLSPYRRSPENREAIPARTQGTIPDWLRGEVVRTCPAVFETNGWRAQHWFDGLGMIYAFRIGATAIDFRSRLLDSQIAREASRGEARRGTFGTPTALPLLRRIVTPVPAISDNTNVNIVRIGSELVALTEGDVQNVINGETLAAIRPVAYPQDAISGAIISAHPHFDFDRGTVVNIATAFGVKGAISIYQHAPDTRKRELIGTWRTDRVPYIHTFGLTPKSAIIVGQPFVVNPIHMLWSSKGYIDHFEWQPQEGTRLISIDRASGKLREHVTEPFVFFHTVNAFERGDETVLDLLAYPDKTIMDSLHMERMLIERPDLRPSLMRIVMRPGVERASIEKLSNVGFEFPTTNYKRVSGRAYRFAYGAAAGPDVRGSYPSAIVKVDIETGKSASFATGKHIFGEPLFVSRPGAQAEDDGVLLSVGSATAADTSMLAVIDASTMSLLASAEVPSSIPLGFHGSFLRAGG